MIATCPPPPKPDRSELARRAWRAERIAALPPQLRVLREVLEERGLLDGWTPFEADMYEPSHLLRIAAAQGGQLQRLAINLYEQLEIEWFGEFRPEELHDRVAVRHRPGGCLCEQCLNYQRPRSLTIEAVEIAVRFHMESLRSFESLPQLSTATLHALCSRYGGPTELSTVAIPVGGGGERDYLRLGGTHHWISYRLSRGQGSKADDVRGLLKRWGLVSRVTFTREELYAETLGRDVVAWRKHVEAAGWRWQPHPYTWTMARIPWRAL